MHCIFCGHNDSKVVDSRYLKDTSIRRRRECLQCGKRFTTYETVETTQVLVIKTNGEREPFKSAKLKNGIIKACEKRPVSMQQIERLVANIEKKVYNNLEDEISSKKIGEYVMDGLKELDEVAYVRFASVYKKFKDISTFFEFINEYEKVLNSGEDK